MPDGSPKEAPFGGTTRGSTCRQIQLFGSIQTTAAITTFVPITTVINTSEQIPCGKYTADRLFRIRTAGVELQRFAGLAAIPLTNAVIRGPQTPAAMSRGGSVTYKVQVSVCAKSGSYQFFMDVGQPIEVYGYRIEVALVGPANAFEVSPTTAANTLAGILIDSLVNVSILAEESPVGQQEVRFTTHHFVLRNTQPAIAVPEHARALKVYTGTGAAAASWSRHIGDPIIIANTVQTGTVDFIGNTSADRCNLVGDETHLQTDLDVNNDRFFTIVWTIRP